LLGIAVEIRETVAQHAFLAHGSDFDERNVWERTAHVSGGRGFALPNEWIANAKLRAAKAGSRPSQRQIV